jgi:hypothetical protein
MEELFGQPYDESDPFWIIRAYMDRMYSDGCFLDAVGNIVKRWGFSVDGAYCRFPDLNSLFEDERFDGVEFSYGYMDVDESIIVSERVCFEFVRAACERYLSLHGSELEKVDELLGRIPN